MAVSNSSIPPIVTVFGGSGFVGRHVVRALAKRGYRVRVACRRPNLAQHVLTLGTPGQVQPVQANVRNRASVDRAVMGADHVVNLVAILHETGKQTFDAVQAFGARAISEAARKAGATLTHVSAIGADAKSDSDYARTKGQAEKIVHEVVPGAVILRPSIIFGPEDAFFNRFAEMSRFSFALPLLGGGTNRMQPVFVGDVAEAVARAVDGDAAPGTTLELGGPEVLTFRECMEHMLSTIDRKRLLVSVPWWAASLMGSVLGMLPKPLLTSDQVKLLKRDNVVSDSAKSEGRTLDGIGIKPQSVEAVTPGYLWRYRPAGQFTRKGHAA